MKGKLVEKKEWVHLPCARAGLGRLGHFQSMSFSLVYIAPAWGELSFCFQLPPWVADHELQPREHSATCLQSTASTPKTLPSHVFPDIWAHQHLLEYLNRSVCYSKNCIHQTQTPRTLIASPGRTNCTWGAGVGEEKSTEGEKNHYL